MIPLILFCSGLMAQDSIKVRKTLFSGNVSTSINKVEYWSFQQQRMETGVKNSVVLSTGINLKHHYNVIVLFYYHVNYQVIKNMPWLPDYSFMVSRDKYLPNTFFWGYNNFGDNKYSNSFKEFRQVLATGTLFYGYHIKLPHKLISLVRIDSTSNLKTSILVNYSPRYYNLRGEFTGGLFDGKPIAVFNIQYILFKGIYFDFSILYHLRKNLKMPWDSDYSYGFGLANGQPWGITFTYSNSNNKFPWSEYEIKSGFLYGNFALGLNYSVSYKKKVK